MTDQTALPPLLAAARALELDRDAASTGESADYRRGMTRAVKLLRLLNEDEPALLDEVRRLQARVVEMEQDSILLSALYAAGVDNWDGYDNAREEADARAELAAAAAGESGSTR